MKKFIFCFLSILLVGCATSRMYDLRQFSSYRLGVVEVGWTDPNWLFDVWVNSQATGQPNFILPSGGKKEWEVKSEVKEVSVCARVWIWDKGKKLVVAETKKSLSVKLSTIRDWEGYGWRIRLFDSDFVAVK